MLSLCAGAALGVACQPGGGVKLAAGVIYHEINLPEGPWWIHVIEIDLPRAWKAGIRLRAANPASGGLEKTSVIARNALAAVNGDFYLELNDQRIRVAGLQILDGCLQQPPQGRSAFAITRNGQPLIAVFRLEAGLLAADGQTLRIAHLNRDPAAAEMSFLQPCCVRADRDSVSAEFGYQLQRLTPASAINDTVPARVMQVRRRAWPLLLEPDQWLVAAGANYPQADRILPGDTVRVFLRLLPKDGQLPDPGDLQEAISGGPRILRDGRVSIEYAEEHLNRNFAEEQHPRTAIGYSRDGRILFLVTVDGRQPGYSVGMSLAELADFMRRRLAEFARSRENAYQGLNLDGGGSTTMVVRQQVVNRPSDQTGERVVASALLVVGPESSR
jgi:exopolysaccharide biosynthesis protein